ncbi:MAG: carboxylating.nicotinate-nucleotide diphosphorylase, partial [Planctomycetes bacterium]|nr:carboxylating.nicotinate-nucleotide diphosphorylase [Planctomycetota bacterium]
GAPIEIEVEDYESFVACMREGVDWILLDNRSPDEIGSWIARAHAAAPAQEALKAASALEASGGIREENIAAYARTGVARISAGAITHSVEALDLSLHVSRPDAE